MLNFDPKQTFSQKIQSVLLSTNPSIFDKFLNLFKKGDPKYSH